MTVMSATESVLAHLSRLVAFPTVSAVSNLELLSYVDHVVTQYGARTRYFPNATADKANLLVSIGPDEPGGVVLSGHTDIVPAEGQPWTGDPWSLRERDGRLIGRGSTDMKGFLACCLASLDAVTSKPLTRPVHLAFSYDEEVGCTGVGSMAEWLGASGLRPRVAVIGEPTGMDLVSAHKGGLIGWTTVLGKPGHSSQPDRYVNAIMVAAELVAEINRIRTEMRDGPRYETLDPPYSTIQVNQIAGGLHGNIVADRCRFFWEMRIIPGESDLAVLDRIQRFARETLEPGMKAVDGDAGIVFEVQARIPGLQPNEDATIEEDLLARLGRPSSRAVSYGTEAGIFQMNGVPSVVIGPGDVADAHQPDESIRHDELSQCISFIERLSETCR